MPGSRFALAACALALALFPNASAFAHPVPRKCHDRTITVCLSGAAAVIHYRLDVDYFTAIYDDLAAFADEIDLPKLTTKEAVHDAFLRCYAPVLGRRLRARLDGKPLEFICVKKAYRLADDDGKPLDHLRFEFDFEARWQPHPGDAHQFTLKEDNFQLEEGRIILSLVGESPVELATVIAPDKTLLERPTRELQPGDDEQLRNVAATFHISSAAKAAAAMPAVAEERPAESSHHSLLDLLLDPHRGFWVLLLLAAGFGAVHALTPGHGKTLVAAYLVGERGTPGHAVLLGLVTTLTHTGAVLILAAVLLYLYPDTVPSRVQAALDMVGGLLVAGDGLLAVAAPPDRAGRPRSYRRQP
jgi:hypothetical protein